MINRRETGIRDGEEPIGGEAEEGGEEGEGCCC